jgi:hypothetical protein
MKERLLWWSLCVLFCVKGCVWREGEGCKVVLVMRGSDICVSFHSQVTRKEARSGGGCACSAVKVKSEK